MKITSLIRFIESHGFPCSLSDHGVVFSIPYMFSTDSATYTVRTLAEARVALGY